MDANAILSLISELYSTVGRLTAENQRLRAALIERDETDAKDAPDAH